MQVSISFLDLHTLFYTLTESKRFIEVCRNMPENSKIFPTVVHSRTTVIFIKAHIQTPMQRIFDTPMLSNCLGKQFDICNRCYEVSYFYCFHIIDNPCAANHSDSTKITPVVLSAIPSTSSVKKYSLFSIRP